MKVVVKAVTDFGVFVDLGGVDGLIHITDLSWGRINHPSEVVKLDETIKVVVTDYDEAKKRISLSLKKLLPHPWENIDEKYKIGDKVSGRVVSLTDYGAFIEIEKGIEGLNSQF
ncbi:MAG: S1 RNA-binding domain-containing protein [Ignavibacteriales bacterium]|nr:S1 RNA-binding domain-containing protein [Ignavibacteriales bacterium]